ncbi:MAG: hypothetical protein K6B43_08135 [Treponema sp.]|nr:hypothetical protein [Treponema sp.]
MNQYKEKYYSNEPFQFVSDAKKILAEENEKLSYEDLFWLSKLLCVYSDVNENSDLLVIDTIRKAFAKGLNIETSKDLYLNAAIILSRLYFKYKKYELAINYFMNLVELLDEIPDWVHLYYAYAQIASEDHFAYVSKVPFFFFARLENVVTDEGKQKRNEIFLYFVRKLIETDSFSDEIAKIINAKSIEYGIERVVEDIIHPVPDYESMLEVYEKRLSEKDKKIGELLSELQDIKGRKALESKSEIEKLTKENAELRNSNNLLETKIVDLQRGISNLTKQLEDVLNSKEEVFENGQSVDAPHEISNGEYRIDGHALLTKFQRNQKILIIGDGNKNKLSQILKKRGFEDKDIEWILDYDKISNIAGQKNFSNYCAIICGPMPHSASGKGDDSSLITALENNDLCPMVIRSSTTSKKLSFNSSAFKRAVNSVMDKLSILDIEV